MGVPNEPFRRSRYPLYLANVLVRLFYAYIKAGGDSQEMPKRRGRPPLAEGQRKDVQVSIRLRHGTVLALERAAQAHGVLLTREITDRLEDTLTQEPRQRVLFGGNKNHSFTLLLGLSLKQLRELTGHWWFEDPFTFRQAKLTAHVLFEYCKPRGKPLLPKDIPARSPGEIRRVGNTPDERSRQKLLGAAAARELIAAMEDFSGEFGKKYERLIPLAPEENQRSRTFNLDLYRRLGSALIPLHKRRSKAGA